jgi:hypothetical protein
MRKILVLEPHEWLQSGFQSKDFGVSSRMLEQTVRRPGMAFDPSIHPVEIVDRGQTAYVVAADVDDEELARDLQETNPTVRAVFSDPEIGPFPTVCPKAAVGAAADVMTELNLGSLQVAGMTGKGVRAAVVDTGIDGTQINVAGGWNPRPGIAPGTAGPDHGTMVAFDVGLAAPDAMIYDYALLQSSGGGQWVAFLSDAIRAFAEIMTFVLQNPRPMVVVNSWGLFNRSGDAPVGDPQNYSANPVHPFNQITAALVGSGADVFFAAGNCRAQCPDSRCGQGDTGPGNSIHGANSHPDVVTVAAVTINGDLLGYSSEGPGDLDQDKPDLAPFSHFHGSGVWPIDGGTSAACPVAAGVGAAPRSRVSTMSIPPGDLKIAMLAGSNGGGQWNAQTGQGVLDAGAALATLP